MHIDPHIIENALKDFLAQKVQEDPGYIHSLMEEVMEDAAFAKMIKKSIDDPENGPVSMDEVREELRK